MLLVLEMEFLIVRKACKRTLSVKCHDERLSLSLFRDPHRHHLLNVIFPPTLFVYSLSLPLSSLYCFMLNIH